MLADNLKRARNAKGLSQEELAARLHVVRQTVSKWEKGISTPDAGLLLALARELSVPVEQLLGCEPLRQPEQDQAQEIARLNEELAALRQREERAAQANQKRGLILFLSFLALVLAASVQNQVAAILLAGGCGLAALAVLYRNLALLTGSAGEGRRLGLLRAVTVANCVILAGAAGFAALRQAGWLDVSQRQGEWLAAGLVSAVMLLGGAVAPRLPFNRYTGLRLPWTVQDAQTWELAHRLLGIISLPAVLLYWAAWCATRDLGIASGFAILLWAGVPGVLSGLFFWKKFHGRR